MNKKITLLIVFVLSTVALSGCSNPSTTSSSNNQPASSTSITKQDSQQAMLNESQYAGSELELIKLINLSTQYTNDQNKDAYMKLLTSDSPIQGIMGKGKITNVEIKHIGDITKNQASISADVTYENNNPTSKIYTFKKQNNKWLLADFD
ncbi:hypothetical protein [Paenibacillus wulumuqiensis]|uniref:hypothetical protein n=1 Tax=Paenibacillus wulumuqiensis TaxID=1567107 RepID=UPI000619E998|nr:hypothetical protein [Paenibacillus wulumuqiensis]